MGRLVKTTPAAQEKQEEKRTVVGTGAHGRLVKTGDVQRTSPAAKSFDCARWHENGMAHNGVPLCCAPKNHMTVRLLKARQVVKPSATLC